jgi:2-polyprenyl-3-methyl-5-hydroxy-6-metoxy-1,4-benzoquinol methylase
MNRSPATVTSAPDIDAVRNYWDRNPILGYEATPGTPQYFDNFDLVKRQDYELFALGFWNFGGFSGKKVLDIGCGAGWFAVNYALAGAISFAIDLTPRAVELVKQHAQYRGVDVDAREANAEQLPFGDDSFDLVHSCGVLHHTPDTQKAMSEAFRVLKPGGLARIALYHRGFLFSPIPSFFVRAALKLLRMTRPGTELSGAKTPDEFIRLYDGADNPLGIGRSRREWVAMLERAGFVIDRCEFHVFPKRFLPFRVSRSLHRVLDWMVPAMIYFRLSKR